MSVRASGDRDIEMGVSVPASVEGAMQMPIVRNLTGECSCSCCRQWTHIVFMGITGLLALGSGGVCIVSWVSSSVIASEVTFGAGPMFVVSVIAFGYIADNVIKGDPIQRQEAATRAHEANNREQKKQIETLEKQVQDMGDQIAAHAANNLEQGNLINQQKDQIEDQRAMNEQLQSQIQVQSDLNNQQKEQLQKQAEDHAKKIEELHTEITGLEEIKKRQDEAVLELGKKVQQLQSVAQAFGADLRDIKAIQEAAAKLQQERVALFLQEKKTKEKIAELVQKQEDLVKQQEALQAKLGDVVDDLEDGPDDVKGTADDVRRKDRSGT